MNFLIFDPISLCPILHGHECVMPRRLGRPGAEPCAEAAFADLGVKHFHGKVICASSSFSFRFLPSYSLSLWLQDVESDWEPHFTGSPTCLPSNHRYFSSLPGKYHSIGGTFPCQATHSCFSLSHWILSQPTRWGLLPAC